jgi:hypothetical protein
MSAVLGMLVIPTELEKSRDVSGRAIDWIGAGLATGGLCLVTFSVTQSGLVKGGWKNACGFSHNS